MSPPQSRDPKRIPGVWFVLLLFGIIVALFLVVYLGSGMRFARESRAASGQPAGGAAAAKKRMQAFIEAMNSGKNLLDQGAQGGEAAQARFEQAVRLNPADRDARLNLANALLLQGKSQRVLKETREALKIDPQCAAAYYLAGCASLRLGRFEEAVKALQTAKNIDFTINAVSFQLGRAYQGLNQFDAAADAFREVVEFDADHPAAYYALSQVLMRLGRETEARKALRRHREIQKTKPALASDPSFFERCAYTRAIAPFNLEQPGEDGVPVHFVNATDQVLPRGDARYLGPVGLVDVGHDNRIDLFLREEGRGFRLLLNTNGVMNPYGFAYPEIPKSVYSGCLVGDLQTRDDLLGARQEDVVVLGDQGCQVFRISHTGTLTDATLFAGLASLKVAGGVLADFDRTGKLDLMAIGATHRTARWFRNQGNMSFVDQTASAQFPSDLGELGQLLFDDWNGDDLPDLFVIASNRPPALYLKTREGGFEESDVFASLPPAISMATGDLNNDLRLDLVVLAEGKLIVVIQGEDHATVIPLADGKASRVSLLDYDNDGWLDLWTSGDSRIRAWRNRGLDGFSETTGVLGLDGLIDGKIATLAGADLDNDCDTDLVITLTDQEIVILRNEGANANHQLKLRLLGNRSNPSAIGVKVKIAAGGLHLIRTIQTLPLEIGLGARTKVDAIDPHWSDLMTSTEYELEGCQTLEIPELELPTGSCPYLYTWDGNGFRFVSDLLGAAPLGLPAAEGVLIAADPDELLWLGNQRMFRPKEGQYVVRITEELREVLYLDCVRLEVVDHPAGTEVHSTSKLLPRAPVANHRLETLGRRIPLRSAVRGDGMDVTQRLRKVDQVMLSPVHLRAPQLRGLAQPYSVTLDFGPLEAGHDLVLALTGWLRFGGGMANVGASHDPTLPFPFPSLEVELASGRWQAVDVVVGAPAGKTKTILVDLSGKLPEGGGRLRLSTAFEIHWDRIALFEKTGDSMTRVHRFAPSRTDLHWRGFSQYKELPWFLPLTPDYRKVHSRPPWLITPSGWCTRYGEVDDLLSKRDDAFVLLNGGDELSLSFSADPIPPVPEGEVRDFFLSVSGWDKDADVHVVRGWTVDPLPWHGMNDQQYGRQKRPDRLKDDWIKKYNTRWVGPRTLARREPDRPAE